MTSIKFSLIIPCYDEEGNIPILIKHCKRIFKDGKFEVIFVENGSNDNSYYILKREINKVHNFKLVRVKKNIGLGHGVVEGLKRAKGDIIGWTHGDLQTDPLDAYKAFKISANYEGDFLIKGTRKKRSISENIFTIGMSIFESILHLNIYWEINGQPNIFTKKFFNTWKNPPLDYLIDLYCYNKAFKEKIKITKFNVLMKKRFSGQSKWNTNVMAKIKFISNTIFYSIKLRFKSANH